VEEIENQIKKLIKDVVKDVIKDVVEELKKGLVKTNKHEIFGSMSSSSLPCDPK
jgi:hypothetical protein